MVMSPFPLIVENAVTRRHGQVLVGPVSLQLDGTKATAIIGPNGAGKTTFLRLLHGTARPHGGEIRWTGDRATAQEAQSFVFQRPVMLRRSVAENLAYPLRIRGFSGPEVRSRSRDWASRVGLEGVMERPAVSLSGGEQQKLALARALITDPKVVFLDEPCASLDGRATREIEAILNESRATGTCLVFSTHNMGQVRRLADQVVFLLGGRIHETGTVEAFLDAPQTAHSRAFLRGDIVE